MNFFAHYLLAKHKNSPSYHCGALLPDIAKRAGFLLLEKQVQPFYANHRDLIDGIRLHWLSDRLFHQSELFQFASSMWKNQLEFADLKGITKTFFLTHLLAEMWLDRVLLSQFPFGGKEMYESLDKVSGHDIKEFSKLILGDQEGKLASTVIQFSKRKFILAYPNPLEFSEIASGVFGHVTKQTDTQFLVPIVQNTLEILSKKEAALFSNWKSFSQQFSGY